MHLPCLTLQLAPVMTRFLLQFKKKARAFSYGFVRSIYRSTDDSHGHAFSLLDPPTGSRYDSFSFAIQGESWSFLLRVGRPPPRFAFTQSSHFFKCPLFGKSAAAPSLRREKLKRLHSLPGAGKRRKACRACGQSLWLSACQNPPLEDLSAPDPPP